MKYLGNKQRIVKDILPFILGALKSGQCYVEPFCGSCSVIQRIPKDVLRIANDNNRYLIAMWEALTNGGWKPPLLIPKDYYDKVRASRNGRFYDGGYSGLDVGGRDYINENIRNTTAQIPYLRSIEWQSGDYSSMTIPETPSSIVILLTKTRQLIALPEDLTTHVSKTGAGQNREKGIRYLCRSIQCLQTSNLSGANQ